LDQELHRKIAREAVADARWQLRPSNDLGEPCGTSAGFPLACCRKRERPAVASDKETEAIKKHLTFTAELAGKILLSAGYDSHDAFIKAVGTLAQVINLITPDDQRASLDRRDVVVENVFKNWMRWSVRSCLASPRIEDT
jgi:hypothetical protein